MGIMLNAKVEPLTTVQSWNAFLVLPFSFTDLHVFYLLRHITPTFKNKGLVPKAVELKWFF